MGRKRIFKQKENKQYFCECGGLMIPDEGRYHPGMMVVRCKECGAALEVPCMCEGQSGYCKFCGVQLDPNFID